jgi:hypothetical protein
LAFFVKLKIAGSWAVIIFLFFYKKSLDILAKGAIFKLPKVAPPNFEICVLREEGNFLEKDLNKMRKAPAPGLQTRSKKMTSPILWQTSLFL